MPHMDNNLAGIIFGVYFGIAALLCALAPKKRKL